MASASYNSTYKYDPAPRHVYTRKNYMGGDMDLYILPYRTTQRLKTELKKNDIVVKVNYGETDERDTLWRVVRINKKSITINRCDQYGTDIPFIRKDYNTELYKCDDGRKFEVLTVLTYPTEE